MPAEVGSSSLDAVVIDQIERMQQRLADHGYGDLGMWNELCRKHVRLLRERGFSNFKRTINFEYNQWSVRSFLDVKLLTLAAMLLLRRQPPRTALHAHMDLVDAADLQWTKGRVTRQRLLAYRLYVGLLWDLATSEDKLGVLGSVEEPSLGRPLGIRLGDRLVTQDLALSSIELNSIARHCDLGGLRRVAEIGAGYGRMAWLVLSTQPRLSYHVFDIPPALAVSQNYLSQCLDPKRIVMSHELEPADGKPIDTSDQPGRAYFHLPLDLEAVEDRSLDLVVNISSFDEMPSDEIEKYFAWIDRKLRGLLYLKGWRYNPATRRSFASFPYRKTWQPVWSRTDPTNPFFVERILRVNSP